MTYRIEPWVEKITSPIIAILADGKKCEYENGAAVVKAIFEKHYVINEISAIDGEVVLHLVENQPQDNYAEGYF